jgi:hypothetical protein
MAARTRRCTTTPLSYARLATAFRQAAVRAGSSAKRVDRLGRGRIASATSSHRLATVQVNQPRQLLEINHKFGRTTMRFVADTVAGWYYRVLEGGPIAASDAFNDRPQCRAGHAAPSVVRPSRAPARSR